MPLQIFSLEQRKLRWFADSPEEGDPTCLCSYCLLPIAEGEEMPLRLVDSARNREARLHLWCWNRISPDKVQVQ